MEVGFATSHLGFVSWVFVLLLVLLVSCSAIVQLVELTPTEGLLLPYHRAAERSRLGLTCVQNPGVDHSVTCRRLRRCAKCHKTFCLGITRTFHHAFSLRH
jgi:hypothetical protein